MFNLNITSDSNLDTTIVVSRDNEGNLYYTYVGATSAPICEGVILAVIEVSQNEFSIAVPSRLISHKEYNRHWSDNTLSKIL